MALGQNIDARQKWSEIVCLLKVWGWGKSWWEWVNF